ncbi:DUF3105 domain-containing protein [Actinopolyspora halophila]|uniref:DUF3105 domain-containing protein n=1 Tax=Actinopolyspora halophila TaxID=1850 RepID=UPI00036FEAAE|nr:DUF3105 domain-containing protein [Actinopolyspora halophila]
MGKDTKSRSAKTPASVAGPSIPWGLVAGVLVVLVFAGGVFGYVYMRYADTREQRAAMSPFVPAQDNQDPSKAISGVVIKQYEGGRHVREPRQVAYDQSPPFGGPHDQYWATCTGTVYEQPIRTENIVHSLEHGAVWVAYQPDELSKPAVDELRQRVEGEQYMLMSPVPTLDRPISLQSWGHQLKLERVDDPRIDQFITALRTNRFTYPEVGASCQSIPGGFDAQNPPPFRSETGPDAVPMNSGGGR